jgi:hypothetical protein
MEIYLKKIKDYLIKEQGYDENVVENYMRCILKTEHNYGIHKNYQREREDQTSGGN